MPPLSVRTRVCDGVVVTAVSGEVDDDAHLVLDEVRAQLEARPAALVLDLRAVTYFGSTGLTALVTGHRQAAQAETKLLVVADQRAVLRPLALTQVDRLVELHQDLPTAVAAAVVPAPRSGQRPMPG
ncbi:hypothetical protein BBK82_42455 [Lentzea guizhouensis]|uniref:Anti-sigma factor antagonist n=1 Tax=Lentzea guizhouensis TaxID=1586287 RepID=A0A1B2I0L1_9PSEU|nr:hypothetical protein BBK82_42455 [Lentzea guizhouensis]